MARNREKRLAYLRVKGKEWRNANKGYVPPGERKKRKSVTILGVRVQWRNQSLVEWVNQNSHEEFRVTT